MSAESTVQQLIEIIKVYGAGADSAAREALSQLADIEVPYPSIASVGFTSIGTPVVEQPNLPSDVPLDDAPKIDDADFSEAVTPETPNITMPELEEMLEITIPEPPELVIPELNLQEPIANISDPLAWSFGVNREDPYDTLLRAISDRLADNVRFGGTGLTPAIEDAIWNRDLERNEQTLQDSTDKVMDMWATKGFSLPDGHLADSLMSLQTEYANKLIDRSREISIEQAKLEQTNIFKSMEIGKDLRLGVMSILIQYEDLFLKSQEYTAKYANEYIDLQIKTYGFFVELFKARAQVYETILRGEIAKVETFKAQIEAQVAISQINEQRVKVYSEKIRAVLAQVDVYKAQIEAMNAFILGTKNKIEANKLTMDAWAVKANALIQEYTGKVSAFRASTEFAMAMAALHSKTEEANLRMGLAAAELNVRSLESYDRVGVAGANVRMEAARGVASAAATLAAGALAAANAHASISHETKEEEE